jgi:enoyl-CoA hydratase
MSNVIYSVSDGIAEIRLNRPGALNSLNPPLLDELEDALSSVRSDQAKALIISGAGRAFCTGADLKSVIALFDEWPRYVDYLYRISDVFRQIENLPLPTIARVHGYALAGGLELILCCDMAIAAEDAMIGDQHANVGLIAGGGGIPRLVRRIGRQNAVHLLYTGAQVTGTQAERLGIVLKAVPSRELDDTISGLALDLSSKSRTSLSYMKRVVLAGADVPLVSALNEERAALLEYFSTSRHPREGIAAFLEKRKPDFDD